MYLLAPGTLKIKLLTAFLVAFVCLNAGGSVCAVYCQAFGETGAKAGHCPLKKADGHCGATEQKRSRSNSAALKVGRLDCCPMMVGFLAAAPFEKRVPAPEAAILVAKAESRPQLPAIRVIRVAASPAVYRGPPFLDRRADRISHHLLLI
jgi:hypothetical protein